MKLFILGIMLTLTSTVFAQLDIKKDYILTKNILCTSGTYAIKICSSGVTLDLGGYTIDRGTIKNNFEGVVVAANVNNIIIKNGTIDGCNNGIVLGGANNVIIHNITISNLKATDPCDYITGINVSNPNVPPSKNVLIKNCKFKFIPVAHKDAIMLGGCDVIVDHIEVNGGGVGVNFGGNGSTGSVINSNFKDVSIAGVSVRHSSSAKIENNKFTNNEIGISTDPVVKGYVSGLTIKNNSFRDCYIGIKFLGTTKSKIIDNDINNKNRPAGYGYRGITLMPNMGCTLLHPINPDSIKVKYIKPKKWTKCFFSTHNVISNNKVTGNIYDLHHEPRCIKNKWIKNIYNTVKGFQIH